MHDHIPEIHQHPAVFGAAFNPSFETVLFLHPFLNFVRKGAKHALAGAGADDKIFGKVGQLVNIEQKDVFTFFLFQVIDNLPRKI